MYGLTPVGARYFVQPPLPTCGERFTLREWDEEFVVFDAATGACHLLTSAAGSVFSILLESSTEQMSVAEVFDATVEGSCEPLSPEEHESLEMLLEGLCEAGLIQKVES